MPALALPPTPVPSAVRPHDFGTGQAEGPEGRELSAAADKALRHWQDRAEAFLAQDADRGELEYTPVPPNRTFFVRTRYIYAGEGKPFPFELDDE